jgi:thioredoxin-dependent peroxiredoxin
MAKKKAKAGKKSTAKKKVAKKKVAHLRTRKTAKKKVAPKAARKVVKKAAKKVVKAKKTIKAPKAKRATKAAVLPKPATKPKRPRRTKQALRPQSRITPPPVADVVAAAPPPAAPPAPSPRPPAMTDANTGFPPPTIDAEVVESRATITLNVGDPAPDFELPDQIGQMHKLSRYVGQPVVLYFYPMDDTPGCTTEACGFRDSLGSFADRNAVVLGISPDPVGSHQRFVQKYGLTFPLLADEGHRVAERYGVWVEKNRFGETSMGIARTTFVIGADGRIKHVFRNVHPEGHEQEVLKVLQP